MITMKGKYNSANIFVDELDKTTKEQIQTFLNHPAFAKSYIAIMPDCHAGVGAVIGFTMKMNEYIIPNVIGVDIGCGMLATNIGTVPLSLEKLDDFIKTNIPSGFRINDKPAPSWTALDVVCASLEYPDGKARRSIGSLGGGNHFIEVGVDPTGAQWLIVHTGSRNFGLSVANFYQKLAKKDLEEHFIQDQYKNLEFVRADSNTGMSYLYAMRVAQDLAKANRAEIMFRLLTFLGVSLNAYAINSVESVHNFISETDNIIRKGAIAAYPDSLCFIPFNMRDGSAICKGKGSSKYNFSAPHGAGRLMSRRKAKETLSLDAFKGGLIEAGVFTTTANEGTLDEAPEAYKPMDFILRNIEETVEVVTMLKPVYNFKAGE